MQNKWNYPEWVDYWGLNDPDNFDSDYADEGALSDAEIRSIMEEE